MSKVIGLMEHLVKKRREQLEREQREKAPWYLRKDVLAEQARRHNEDPKRWPF